MRAALAALLWATALSAAADEAARSTTGVEAFRQDPTFGTVSTGIAAGLQADTRLFSVPLGRSEVHLSASLRYLQDPYDAASGEACALLRIVIPLRRPRGSWVFPIRDWWRDIDASGPGR